MTKKKTETVTQPKADPHKEPGSVTDEATERQPVEGPTSQSETTIDDVQRMLQASVDPDEAPAVDDEVSEPVGWVPSSHKEAVLGRPTLIDQIREQRKLADVDLDIFPVVTRGAFAVAKGNALEVAQALEKQYSDFVDKTSVLLFIESPAKAFAERFGKIAVEVGPVVLLDANDVYARLAKACQPASVNNGNTFSTSEYGHLVSALAELGSELDLRSIPRPRFEEVAFGRNDFDLLTAHVRRLVELSMDSSLLLEVFKRERLKQALTIGFDLMVPVVIINASPAHYDALKQNLLQDTSRAMTQTVADPATTASVEKTLVSLVKFASRH